VANYRSHADLLIGKITGQPLIERFPERTDIVSIADLVATGDEFQRIANKSD
jgi:hypothetical protein